MAYKGFFEVYNVFNFFFQKTGTVQAIQSAQAIGVLKWHKFTQEIITSMSSLELYFE